MRVKCSNCGKMFEDKMIDKLKVDKQLAKRIWCNDCVAKLWRKSNAKVYAR